MLFGTINKNGYDVSLETFPESFDLATSVEISAFDVTIYFKNYSTFNVWYDGYTDATVAFGFDIHGTGEPWPKGLVMERIHETLAQQEALEKVAK
ncbi:hypothetical protein LIX87_00835 [Weissella viridescens]|uniref:hypothetical protein n=1 Tax=Weissella viridescens TaxID=1629 RepID=UPI001D0938F3|nr:hypothetical protein [Weissella viridescens]MCB6839562.1 hypothetical protein [Weissella viridescens]MCB6846293.1 hypothetical protein [Weissella viridescens]